MWRKAALLSNTSVQTSLSGLTSFLFVVFLSFPLLLPNVSPRAGRGHWFLHEPHCRRRQLGLWLKLTGEKSCELANLFEAIKMVSHISRKNLQKKNRYLRNWIILRYIKSSALKTLKWNWKKGIIIRTDLGNTRSSSSRNDRKRIDVVDYFHCLASVCFKKRI